MVLSNNFIDDKNPTLNELSKETIQTLKNQSNDMWKRVRMFLNCIWPIWPMHILEEEKYTTCNPRDT